LLTPIFSAPTRLLTEALPPVPEEQPKDRGGGHIFQFLPLRPARRFYKPTPG